MATGFAGTNARLFPWQTKHYIIRGGPFDPAIPSTGTAGSLLGGYLNILNAASQPNQITLPPVPGTQSPPNIPIPRVQNVLSTGTFTASTAVLATNTGGVYIGTIPGGSWIESVEMFCYLYTASGTATSFGVFYAPSESVGVAPGFQPTTLFALAYQTTPATNTLYSTRYVGATANGISVAGSASTQFTGWIIGPGTGPTGTFTGDTGGTLASNGPPGGQGIGGAKDLLAGGVASIPGDIDLYFVNFAVGGSGTTPTAGNFQVKVEFTGLAG
jgi:hypothetical protein